MGTAFAGVVRAPMTSVVMIFEITRDYAVIVPLMISNLGSYFIASRLQKEPIYEVLAEQDGIHLPTGGRQSSKMRQVVQVLRPATDVLQADETLEQVFGRVSGSEQRSWIVRGSHGVIGLIHRKQMESEWSGPGAGKKIEELLIGTEYPHLHADHSLDDALDRMGASGADVLPVVSRADIHQLLGIVRLPDVLEAYGLRNKEGN
jgi:CIC family chloride channel protein